MSLRFANKQGPHCADMHGAGSGMKEPLAAKPQALTREEAIRIARDLESPDKAVRFAAVAELTNVDALIYVASSSGYKDTRMAAFEKLAENVGAMEFLANNSRHEDTRMNAEEQRKKLTGEVDSDFVRELAAGLCITGK